MRGYERFRNQIRHHLHGPFRIGIRLSNRLRRLEGERSHENRQPENDPLLLLGQQVVAPVEHRIECLMPGERGAPALPNQLEAQFQQFGGATNTERTHAPCGQFERQRDAIQLAADAGNQVCVRIAQINWIPTGGRTLHEQLHGRKHECLSGGTDGMRIGRSKR